MVPLLSVRQVSEILQITIGRVYQLDDDLKPVMVVRGTKMRTRLYRPEDVERVRLARRAPAADVDLLTGEVLRLREVIGELKEIALEGFSRGWDDLDRQDRVERIERLVES